MSIVEKFRKFFADRNIMVYDDYCVNALDVWLYAICKGCSFTLRGGKAESYINTKFEIDLPIVEEFKKEVLTEQ